MRQKGLDVDAKHLHLEMAARLGLNQYNQVVNRVYMDSYVGDLLFAACLYPDKKDKIVKYLAKYYRNPNLLIKKLHKCSKDVYKNIQWRRYKLVGFTIDFDQIFSSLLFAAWIKRDFPHIKIVFGGPHVADELGKSMLKCFSQIDWCIDGEGEIALSKLIERLSKAETGFEKDVPGLIYRVGDSIRQNERQKIRKLSDLPDPDYNHYFQVLKHHRVLKNRQIVSFLPIEGTRGCPYRCAFCSVFTYWQGYRVRPDVEVINQLSRLSNKYKFNRFRFVDRGIPFECWSELSKKVQNGGNDLNIHYQLRANVEKEQLRAMKQAGVHKVQIGLDAMSASLLKKMNKGIRVIDNLQTIKYCDELGVEHISNLIIGFPTESQKDVDEGIKNIDFACCYRPPIRFIPFRLEYNAPAYNNPGKYGITKMWNAIPLNQYVDDNVASNLLLLVKKYRSRKKELNYSVLKKRLDRWQQEYNDAVIDNIKLLSYYDCRTYLRIEDLREDCCVDDLSAETGNTITLEKETRKLYLFCDSYKSFDQIKKRFPRWNLRELKKTLNQLVRQKVMFREDDDYLSLAIRANPARRN